jgi:hypothetical protein
VLRRLFGPERDKDGSCRKLHNDELHNLNTSPHIVRVIKSRRMRWAGYVARMGEERGVYWVSVGRPEGKRPLGRPRRAWENKFKLDLREVGIVGTNWIRLAQDRVHWRYFVNMVMNFGFHKESRIFFDKLSDYQLFKEYPAPRNKLVHSILTDSMEQSSS